MQQSRAITRSSASNLALAFILLPKSKREAMSVLYAFCRQIDDIADDESSPVEVRREKLAAWRAELHLACHGRSPEFPVTRELQPVIAQYHLPFRLLDELLLGVEMDLDVRRYPGWDELEVYCYRVASVVGLLSIEIFGYTEPACRDYAVYLGKALQLTNILRDVRADALRGRIYLPLNELERFGLAEQDVLGLRYSRAFCAVARAVAERARHFYHLASRTLPAADRRSMRAAELMGAVYWRLLRKLEGQDFNVFGPQPTRLSRAQKTCLILRAWYRSLAGILAPDYG